jgi:hypothetical protein
MSSNQSRFGLLGGQMAESKKVQRFVKKTGFDNTIAGAVIRNNRDKKPSSRPINPRTGHPETKAANSAPRTGFSIYQ